tara:strand:- start:865 stop:2109 length:1245 start_codon:yes stop_codon:yes gene_type:complete
MVINAMTQKSGRGKPLYFTVDLMLTEDNDVRILELNDGFASGFTGYDRAYGQNYKYNLEDAFIEKHGIILDALNRDYLFALMLESKYVFDAFIPDELRPLLPKTRAYAVCPGEEQGSKIQDDFKGTSDVIVKGSTGRAGMEVFLIALSDLMLTASPAQLNILLRMHRNLGPFSYGSMAISNAVVQEVIRPGPVFVDTRPYLGTIRVGVLAVPDAKGCYSLKITGHDEEGNGYYKLPNKPAPARGETLREESLKSDISAYPVSAPLGKKDLQHIKAELDRFLLPALEKYMSTDLSQKLTMALDGDENKFIAALIAVQNMNSENMEGQYLSDAFYKKLGERLPAMCLKNPYIYTAFVQPCFHLYDPNVREIFNSLREDSAFTADLNQSIAQRFYNKEAFDVPLQRAEFNSNRPDFR